MIPLEILSDISALREMIIDVANWRYKLDHPQRKRSPKRFAENVSLNLVGINEGSAIPLIDMTVHASGSSNAPELPGMPSELGRYLNEARASIIAAVGAAERDEPIVDHLPQELLRHFNRIGTRLRSDESVVFAHPGSENRPRLTQESRRRLLDASKIKEFTNEVTIRGSIPEVDQDRMSFELQLPNGRKLAGKMHDHNLDTIMETFNRYATDAKVLIRGIGRYDRKQRLARLEMIDELIALDPLDVPARLDELRELRDGWYDGEGEALDGNALNWLSESFDSFYPNESPLPHVYPTVDGGVQAEWSFPPNEISLEIDLATRCGKLHLLNLENDAEETETFDLKDAANWMEFSSRIELLSAGQA